MYKEGERAQRNHESGRRVPFDLREEKKRRVASLKFYISFSFLSLTDWLLASSDSGFAAAFSFVRTAI